MAQANQGIKVNTKTEIDSLNDGSTFIVNQLINGVLKVRQLTKEDFIEQFVGSFVNPIVVTYAELLALSAANNLRVGAWYKITNATAASFNLLVQAIDVNKISCDARDPLYPNDKIMYNFASNVITWRWDTIRDVSAGEDWRNSNNLQIDDEVTNSHIEANATNIIIKSGATVINIGINASNITIGEYSSYITIKDNCNTISIEDGMASGQASINYIFQSGIEAVSILNTQNNGFSSNVEKSVLYDGANDTKLVSYLWNNTFIFEAIAV